jgi:hypothetical protein
MYLNSTKPKSFFSSLNGLPTLTRGTVRVEWTGPSNGNALTIEPQILKQSEAGVWEEVPKIGEKLLIPHGSDAEAIKCLLIHVMAVVYSDVLRHSRAEFMKCDVELLNSLIQG